MKLIEPSRLVLARKRAGLTASALARLVDVTPQSIHNYEAGRQSPSEETLGRIAGALTLPESFFRLGPVSDITADEVSFRARTKMASRVRGMAICSAQLAVEVRDYVLSNFKVPSVDVPYIEQDMEPALAADYVRSRWGLDRHAPAPNMVHLLESKGVAVFSLPPLGEHLDAFAFWRNDEPFVLLNLQKSAERGRFDAAHELGHLVLHRDTTRLNGRDIEREANEFASSFLIPATGINRRVRSSITLDRILQEKSYWRVAAMAMAYRLHALGLLSDWSYRSNIIALGRLGYRTGEPAGMERERSLLFQKVFAASGRGAVIKEMSSETGLPLGVLGELTFSVEPTTVPSLGAASPSAKRMDEVSSAWPRPKLKAVGH
ncbi:ImmA/IrrE family metallo-endopeptidase [Kineococcus sp. R8]|nr:ImmA/IrrE family metallo-endopeptidase [Kineococcus siccus]